MFNLLPKRCFDVHTTSLMLGQRRMNVRKTPCVRTAKCSMIYNVYFPWRMKLDIFMELDSAKNRHLFETKFELSQNQFYKGTINVVPTSIQLPYRCDDVV